MDNGAIAGKSFAISWKIAGAGDFNGDGRDDILWRNEDGSLSSWLGTATGAFIDNVANAGTLVPLGWNVAGIGDFNGDGRDDLLWRNSEGSLTKWLGADDGGFDDNGGFFDNPGLTVEFVSPSWNVVGIGDFNGDARADILWRSDNGTLTNWLSTATGGFAENSANATNVVDNAWNVANVGDYNGDGRSDILWRHADGRLVDWLGTATGGFLDNAQASVNNVPSNFTVAGLGDFNGDFLADVLWRSTSALTDWLGTGFSRFDDNDANARVAIAGGWHVAGTGDFNGDLRDDILWRNDNGAVSNWLGKADGGFDDNGGNAGSSAATSWNVVGTGNFNGDFYDDILWRNDDGTLSVWLGAEKGSFTDKGAIAGTNVPTSWHVAGTGNFNGDAYDDILWRNDNGALSNWFGNADGGFDDNGDIAGTHAATSWQVAGVGDFDGDGIDDILWRNDAGWISNWLGTPTGRFADNGGISGASRATSWHIDGIGDISGDGIADILWRNDDGRVTNWLGTDTGAFVNNDVNSLTYLPLDWEVQAVDYVLI